MLYGHQDRCYSRSSSYLTSWIQLLYWGLLGITCTDLSLKSLYRGYSCFLGALQAIKKVHENPLSGLCGDFCSLFYLCLLELEHSGHSRQHYCWHIYSLTYLSVSLAGSLSLGSVHREHWAVLRRHPCYVCTFDMVIHRFLEGWLAPSFFPDYSYLEHLKSLLVWYHRFLVHFSYFQRKDPIVASWQVYPSCPHPSEPCKHLAGFHHYQSHVAGLKVQRQQGGT